MSQELAELSICPNSLLTLLAMPARSPVASARNVGAAMELAARQVQRKTDERMLKYCLVYFNLSEMLVVR